MLCCWVQLEYCWLLLVKCSLFRPLFSWIVAVFDDRRQVLVQLLFGNAVRDRWKFLWNGWAENFFFLLFLIFFFLCRSLFASRKVRLYILPFTTIARVVAIFVHSRSTSLRSYLPLVGIHSFSRSHYRIYSIPLPFEYIPFLPLVVTTYILMLAVSRYSLLLHFVQSLLSYFASLITSLIFIYRSLFPSVITHSRSD